MKKLVYISSTGAIPEREGNLPIKEVSQFPTGNLVGYYSVTKAEASQLVLNALELVPELDASIIHPSGICGPDDYSFGPVADFIIQYASGNMSAGIEGTFNSVDVRDLADGVIACLDKGKRGECYIMSNSLVSMKDMFGIINEAANLDHKPRILSAGIAKVMAKLMKVGSKITGKTAQLTDFAIYNLTRNNNFDCSKACTELGFKCRPFEETILDGPPLEDLFNFYMDPLIRYKSAQDVIKETLNEKSISNYNSYLKALNINMVYTPFLLIYVLERICFWTAANEKDTSNKYLALLNQINIKN